MKAETFNTVMTYMFATMMFLILVLEIKTLKRDSIITDKIEELSNKVGVECNVTTNSFIFESRFLKTGK